MKVTLDLPEIEGFEYTGEYRQAKTGEPYMILNGKVESCIGGSNSLYPILKKIEPEYIVIDHIHSIAAADAGRFVSINALEDMWVLVQLKSSEWDVEHMHMAAKLELLIK